MRGVLRALPVLPLCFLAAEAIGQELRVWRTNYTADTGGTRCASGPADVWESPQKFTLRLQNSKWEIWSVDLAADGSADKVLIAQGVNPTNRPEIRVTIPPGRGPRQFRILNRSMSCDYVMVPGDYVK